MDVKGFATRAAGVSGTSAAGIPILDIIQLVLPILLGLPCFKPKSPEAKREWIENHPNIARNRTINAIRGQQPGLKRSEAADIADRVLDEALGLSEAEFTSVCQSAGA